MDSKSHVPPLSSTPTPQPHANFIEPPSQTVSPTLPPTKPCSLTKLEDGFAVPLSPPPQPQTLGLPPPIPVSIVTKETPKRLAQKHTFTVHVKSDDARAKLMEDIRNAGGKGKANLRTIKDLQSRKEAECLSMTTGVDLMADLHAKLYLRRKYISGSQPGSHFLKKFMEIFPSPTVDENISDTDGQTDTDTDWED